MEEQEANSFCVKLRNVSGLSFNAAEGGRSGDNMNLRGFYTFLVTCISDGIRDTCSSTTVKCLTQSRLMCYD